MMAKSSLWHRLLGAFLGLCLSVPAMAADQPLSVYTSVPPVRTFISAVGGERVAVEALVQPGQSPVTFDPGPRTLAALEGAALYFRVGVAFERAWMDRLRAAAPGMTVIDLREGLKLRSMAAHDHDHGHVGDPDGGVSPDPRHPAEDHVPADSVDPHIWTSPANAVIMVRRIRDALVGVDPAGRGHYRRNAARYIEALQALDQRLADRLAPHEGQVFVVFHPAWGYFAARYGLIQRAIEAGGRQPGPSALNQRIREVRELGARAVFVQDQFSQRAAKAVAKAVDARVVSIDPLDPDYIANLERVGRRLAEALD